MRDIDKLLITWYYILGEIMINITTFDCLNGTEIKAFTLKNQNLEVTILNFGGIIQSFKVFDKEDIVLGFDNVSDYLKYDIYAGAVVGRVANVIENAKYTLNGETYTLTKNAGENCNHSGLSGFDKRIFDYKIDGDKLILSTFSPDGEGGFGGNLNFKVEYSLNDSDLLIEFTANSDKDTPFAPTMHPYFNLSGGENIYDTILQIKSDTITAVDSNGVPTGELLSVKNTPFDFTLDKPIGKDIFSDNKELKRANGYDINYLTEESLKAIAYDKKSGITLGIYSDMLGVQLYTANDLSGEVGKNGKIYRKHGAFCIEPQFVPNAVNKPIYDSPIIKKNQEITHYIAYSTKLLK